MRKTLCQAHKERLEASAAAAHAVDGYGREYATVQEQWLMRLARDKRRLKDVQSIERRKALKAEIIGDYAAYLAGVLDANPGTQDDVASTLMVWRFDAGDIPGGLDLAAYCLEHGLTMPDQYKRDLPTVVAEEVADYCLAPDSPGVRFDDLLSAYNLTLDFDMPDEVRGKLHKCLGRAYAEREDPAQAVHHLKRALTLHPRAGVKKELEILERQARREAEMEGRPPTD